MWIVRSLEPTGGFCLVSQRRAVAFRRNEAQRHGIFFVLCVGAPIGMAVHSGYHTDEVYLLSIVFFTLWAEEE